MRLENYEITDKITFRDKIRPITSHPYFGFIVAALLLVLVQVLEYAGILGVSTSRAFGQTIINFIAGLGFTLLLGYAGLASLGTAGFIGLGTYIIGYFAAQYNAAIPYTVTLLISIVIAVIIGSIVGFISLRIEGMYLAIITLGLSEILIAIFKNAVEITGGPAGLRVGSNLIKLFGMTMSHREIYFLLIIVMLVGIIFTLNLIKSPIGRSMLAMKNSPSAAQAMGISMLKSRLLAFLLSTVFSVVAGGLYMMYFRYSEPNSWSLALSLNILAAVVVGGAKSIWGVLLGTFVIFGLDLAVLKRFAFFIKYPDASLIFSGLLIILVVMFYPGGLIRLFSDLKKIISKKLNNLKKKWREKKYGKDE
ncbi:MAG: branched-chain amino acid ABC transporter permease [Acholeplasma sp.]|nr:branched-chain amino acid ABC transporter permease [Acholeplasma sp.]